MQLDLCVNSLLGRLGIRGEGQSRNPEQSWMQRKGILGLFEARVSLEEGHARRPFFIQLAGGL